MKEPTDEQLMSFADGKLDEETRRWVAEAVDNSPELTSRVAMYRATGSILGDIVARDMPARANLADDELARKIRSHPLPQDRLRDGPVAARNGIDPATPASAPPASGSPATGGGTVVQFPGRAARMSRRPTAPNLALAAGIAALLAGALAMTMLQWRTTAPGGGTPGSKTPDVIVDRSSSTSETNGISTTLSMATLAPILESTPSDHDVFDGTWTVKPIVTFKALDGRYCREYVADHRRDATVAVSGVACRSAGGWASIAQAPTTPRTPAAERGSTAGRTAPPRVEDAIKALRDTDVMEKEQDLIKDRWKIGN